MYTLYYAHINDGIILNTRFQKANRSDPNQLFFTFPSVEAAIRFRKENDPNPKEFEFFILDESDEIIFVYDPFLHPKDRFFGQS